ncbi:MAG: hypothetical protein ACTIC1_14455 [Brevibacterium sp.]|uniref:hypothetical protein n=1 Tax=unclassified Brevibacterium TaxID=2614124 RepID=UPI00186800B4|nr:MULTISPECIES: hypothetical protein [unclassified Brevibacterium]
MVPTTDLSESIAAHVAGGLEVLWHPDSHTTLLGANQRACVMVEDDLTERDLGVGPVLLVDDLSTLTLGDAARLVIPVMNVPVGRYAAIDHAGTVLRYLDLTMCEDNLRIWFETPKLA